MTAAAVRPKVGDRLEARSFGPITRTDIVRYQGASGDFNPIHHDETMATAAGFPTVFSVGMLQAGLLATFATDCFPAESLRRYATRFKEQCWPDDVLTCEGVVASTTETAAGLEVVVDLTCSRQTGGTAIEATAVFLLPPAGS